jgi:para-nitrobenzyl esterase
VTAALGEAALPAPDTTHNSFHVWIFAFSRPKVRLTNRIFGGTVRQRLAGIGIVAALALTTARPVAGDPIKTTGGLVGGSTIAEGGVRLYRSIPYAAPPVGELRWQAPKPVVPWQGVLAPADFGPRCLQGRIFDDIVFKELSEDCLTLNIWTPARSAGDRLPVLVWIHGGGFQAGAGAEPRHDGEAFARKNVVLVTINYRLGVFGFLAHPELTRESGRTASGNYGLLDQVAALKWVRDNIAAFGGDSRNVTIFGESAGSFAVSALMASPLARGLFHKAIGQSGAFFSVRGGTLLPKSLSEAEEHGTRFATTLGASSLAALRAKSGDEVLQAAMKMQPWFSPIVDGYFLPEPAAAVYAAGKQAPVPLLAGWNADEVRAGIVLAKQKPTAQTFTEEAGKRFGEHAAAILKAYPASNDAEAMESAAALANDTFIGYSTWKWLEMHAKTTDAPVYRYSFDRKIPVPANHKVNGVPATSADVGARHAGEIEYVFGALKLSLPNVPWEAADRTLSDAMTTYWANFARTGNPSGSGLPEWPRYDETLQVLHLDTKIHPATDSLRPRYEAWDAWAAQQQRTN